MVIYTKKGDQGYASLLSGEHVPKNHEIILIVGKIDSLQASLDSANVMLEDENIKKIISEINEKLWQIAGEISNQQLSEIIKKPVTEEDIHELEKTIDKYHLTNNYFIRFSKETSTRINESRVRTRELESLLTKMLLEQKIRGEIYRYLNRLSDLLYALACKEESQ